MRSQVPPEVPGTSSESATDIEKIHAFQRGIIAYWEEYGRHNLPWRLTRDPWKLLIAEVLLRKTTSGQAVAVFQQLSMLSPEQIIALEISDLEAILKPLGLYKVRAQQLRLIADSVARADTEHFMSDEFLRSLPGVGRYISNTVRCCAFDISAPGLDTNMIRILERVFGWKAERSRAREDRKLWELAKSVMPLTAPCQFNWGILDFAASVCTLRSPKCPICPLQNICTYYCGLLAQ